MLRGTPKGHECLDSNGRRAIKRISMCSRPKVSVLIPAFNAEEFIGEAIYSVLKQDFQDFELIVINDGSDDNTAKIVLGISDNRIRLINQANVGHCCARNRGIKESIGEYIAFLDADDVWSPYKLGKQVSLLDEKSEYGMIYSRGKVINAQGDYLRPFAVPGFEGYILDKLLFNASLIHSSSVIIRKKIIDVLGAFDEKLRSYEDWDLWLRVAVRYHIGFINEPLFLLRVTKSGNSARKCREQFFIEDLLFIINRVFEQHEVKMRIKSMKPLVLSNAYKMEGFRNMYFYQMRKARQYFLQSIKHNPLKIELYFALVYTILGSNISNFIHQKIWLSIKKYFMK